MDPLLRVSVTRPSFADKQFAGKQVEIIQVQQQESYFNLVTESNSIFFSPAFKGRMRCGSKIIDAKNTEPVAAYLGKGYPLVIDASSMVPWWIVHIHDGAPRAQITEQEALPAITTSVETMSFYKIHSGQDFLVANM